MSGQEEFSEKQLKILEQFVTNTSGNVFVVRNLPEVIKGALFSRYSRSASGLRSLLLQEFILNEETAFVEIAGLGDQDFSAENQYKAIQKAQNFYDRILDGYGDDSIGELGGAHLAMENVSILAAKVIEDVRIGGSPLEKSTRYIYFDQKVNNAYLFYQEPMIMASAYRDLYLETCNFLFDTYCKLIPSLTAVLEKKFPREHHISKSAYTAALRAKVLDCIRGLLPASALTNLGIYGNGRFYDHLLRKMQTHNLAELQELGRASHGELFKVIPSFIRRSDPSHKFFQSYATFMEHTSSELSQLAHHHAVHLSCHQHNGVFLIHSDEHAVRKVAAGLLFEYSSAGLEDLEKYCDRLSEEDLSRILDAGSAWRENRRHKSPRALERADFTFEILADFGAYRDLQRHRLLSQQRQKLTCQYGYYIPEELQNTDMEKEYIEAMGKAKKAYDIIATELPEEAQYVVPLAYHLRFYFHCNLRELQWLCELRSSPAGHSNYRYIAQEMALQVCKRFPSFERYFKFMDYEGYELGRMGQEIRREEKRI
ncbi:MAG: FAD-dependent thymidylate synthase [Parachlamydiales bacterium]|nr:FAD-dependent thymidylate synthase [Parachlamydiales bacterium]